MNKRQPGEVMPARDAKRICTSTFAVQQMALDDFMKNSMFVLSLSLFGFPPNSIWRKVYENSPKRMTIA